MFVELAGLFQNEKGMILMSLTPTNKERTHYRLSVYPHPDHVDDIKLSPICLDATPQELDAPGIDFSPVAEHAQEINEQIKRSAPVRPAPKAALPASTAKKTTPAASGSKPAVAGGKIAAEAKAADAAAAAAAAKAKKEKDEADKKAAAEAQKLKAAADKKKKEVEALRAKLAALEAGTSAQGALPIATEGGS